MSSSNMIPIGILLFMAGVITLVVIANTLNKEQKKSAPVRKPIVRTMKQIVETPVIPEVVEEAKKVDEDPHDAFPQMSAESGDADAELASAFTYENLQDSMITSVREARDALKSRAPWSRFGERANPEVWEAQMAELKNEIIASGKTFEEFAENSWAPIPEQMADYWKSQQSSQIPETKTHRVDHVSKSAMSEAPALLKDATQEIGKTEVARSRMDEILRAMKRAKSLKLKLPELSEEQKKDIQYWSTSPSKKASELANAIIGF